MLGKMYKEYATELGLNVRKELAFGEIDGFMSTFTEAVGRKDILITLTISKEETLELIQKALMDDETVKKYRLEKRKVFHNSIEISFHDKEGTLDCIREFVKWFYPMIKEAGAVGHEFCPKCKQVLEEADATTQLINNECYRIHRHCANQIRVEMQLEVKKEYSVLALLTGTLGGILGGVLATIPWAIVGAMGWFVGWLGYLIGFCIQKGYSLFGGKLRKAAVPIMVVIVIVCVILGELLADGFSLGYDMMKNGGDWIGYQYSDIPGIIKEFILEDAEFRKSFLINIGIGLLFAAFGTFAMFKEMLHTNQKITGTIEEV